VKHLRAFAQFWWNFIVGDDWRVALGIALAIALTWLLAHRGANVWWLLPVAVVLVLTESLRRATKSGAS
jgi:hypothetical protein